MLSRNRIGGSVNSLVGPVAKTTTFNVLRDRRRAHNIESRTIQRALLEVDSVKCARILEEIADPLVSGADEVEWFVETGELIETLNERARVEEEK